MHATLVEQFQDRTPLSSRRFLARPSPGENGVRVLSLAASTRERPPWHMHPSRHLLNATTAGDPFIAEFCRPIPQRRFRLTLRGLVCDAFGTA